MIEEFATKNATFIIFISIALCLAGIYAAMNISSSVFPQTNFPRVVILVDNGVMPADEMMATITRPIEEAMKDIPGVVTIRSETGRGSADISVFFNWKVDMIQAELYVLGRLAQIKSSLPPTCETTVYRLTFSAFPILGVSLTSDYRDITELWEVARYNLKLRFLRIPGVARVDLVGGRMPEFQLIVDPLRLAAANLTLAEIADALNQNNLVASAGLHEENHRLYLTVVDGRVHTTTEIADFVVKTVDGHPVRVRDFARVERGPEPVFNIVTADGHNAVLLNIRSQPDGSTLFIARELKKQIAELKHILPPDMKLAFFYDQSEIVRASVRSVWEAIFFGLALSIFILYFFLKDWRTTLVAITVIPVTVLVTLVGMKLTNLTYNLMTLGGIAAAIGLVIDDAIVVVEAIHTKLALGLGRHQAIKDGLREILHALVGSTLTPVVVFLPLAFLQGITGVFFRALAMTMVVALLTSLALAVSLTPSLATWIVRPLVPEKKKETKPEEVSTKENGISKEHNREEGGGGEVGGFILRRLIGLYEKAVRIVLRWPLVTLSVSLVIILLGLFIYRHLESEFLPPMDEGGFVIDYFTPPGTSLAETNRQLLEAEKILRSIPEVESYSRRTGARLALAIAEPNTGDFLVKLRPDRRRKTAEVISELRHRFNTELPGLVWEFPGILSDLIGDLMWAPQPIEVKLFSTDQRWLEKKAPEVEQTIKKVRGVVDTFHGLVYTGPTISLKPKMEEARRFGFTNANLAEAVNAAMLGQVASTVLQADRVINIRVKVDPSTITRLENLKNLPLRTPEGGLIKLSQVVEIIEEPGQLEIRREDMRQDVAVTARLEGRDLGSAMKEIKELLSQDKSIPPGTIEYGGLYQQQQESFRNLLVVLITAVILVFTVLLLEFGSFYEPVAIIFGAILAMFGTVAALYLTGTSLNVVSILGAIIGIGIVAKNGILLLDYTKQLQAQGWRLVEALVRSGRRRLRPVLMTSLAAALGMLPLAYGIGSGADMLKPLAIAVIGALTISVLLSLLATPTMYYLLKRKK